MPSEEDQQHFSEEEQSLPTGADLLAEHIAQAEETIRRIRVILEQGENKGN